MMAARSQSRSTTSSTWEVRKIGRAVPHLIEQNVLHQSRAHGVDAFKRLVHQKEFGPMDQRRRHGDALAHAFGIFGDQLPALVREFEKSSSSSARWRRQAPVEAVHAADEFEELARR